MSSSTMDTNPTGTDGFEFVEYTADHVEALERLFERMGFRAVARHRSKQVSFYRQGDINFILNHEPDSFAQAFAKVHGPSVCAFVLRVRDARRALERAIELGANPYHGTAGPMENLHRDRVGPIFFQIIERRGNEGFGEGELPGPVRGHRGRPAEAWRDLMTPWIPLPVVEGEMCRQADADLPEGTYERELGN